MSCSHFFITILIFDRCCNVVNTYMKVQNIEHFSLLKELFSWHLWAVCCFVFMAPRITEEPKGISIQPVYMLESRCNHELFWDTNILVVFPALQQGLTQLRLIRFLEHEMMKLRFSHIFLIQAKCLSGNYMHRSVSCIKNPTFPVSRLLTFLNGRLALGFLKSLLWQICKWKLCS